LQAANQRADSLALQLTTTQATLAETEKKLASFQQENDQLKQETSCVICFEGRRDVLFMPCLHFQVCGKCAASLADCCLCRKKLMGKVQVYQ